ncbi:MAG TPA: metal ABC transporter substrate-binding protein [Actinomycetota bacterium]
MRRVRSAVAIVALAVVAGACAPDRPSGSTGDRLAVAATVSPIANIVANIGGDRVRVTGLVPEGENSHEFEPRPTDARIIVEADVVIMNGLHLEEPTRVLAEANVRDGVKIVKLGDLTITPDEYIYDFSFPREQGDPNPHLWTNPPYAKRYAEIVTETLSTLRPDDAAYFRRNLDAYAQRLDELDRLVREVTETVPAGNRKLLTYHDSFPYFAREYGWEIIGAIQPSDLAEPTPREVARLIEQVRDEGVPAIFGSEVFPSPVLEQIARETGARYVDELRDDDLPGDAGDHDHSFLAMMTFNFSTFMEALGGDVTPFEQLDTSNLHPESNAEYRG